MSISLAKSHRWRRVVLLLVLGLAVRVSGLGLHSLSHEPGAGYLGMPVSGAAKHAEDRAHLEAGEILVYVGCPACLLLQSSGDLSRPATAPSSGPTARNPAPEAMQGFGQSFSTLHDSRAPPIA